MARMVAHVLADTELADDCLLHQSCVIDYPPSCNRSLARIPAGERLTRIGSRSEVMPFAIVYRGAHIGEGCLIGSHATVREDATIGDRCIIGQYACISYDAELADEVRVQNGTLIADGWKIGRGTFVGVNVSTMSDRDPRAYEFHGSIGSVIGERCLIGSGAVILPGLRIGDDVVIGAGALVTKDVPSGATVLGEPSRIVRETRSLETVHGADHWR